jgi:hypothetical protein
VFSQNEAFDGSQGNKASTMSRFGGSSAGKQTDFSEESDEMPLGYGIKREVEFTVVDDDRGSGFRV